ncbi:hypothetical protein GQR58_012391 [Nymphon striatum]|nr:hypothetical protein GQR58_012391 [Nymphon striatum]
MVLHPIYEHLMNLSSVSGARGTDCGTVVGLRDSFPSSLYQPCLVGSRFSRSALKFRAVFHITAADGREQHFRECFCSWGRIDNFGALRGASSQCHSSSDCKKTLTCMNGICNCLPTQKKIGPLCTQGTPGTVCKNSSTCNVMLQCFLGLCACDKGSKYDTTFDLCVQLPTGTFGANCNDNVTCFQGKCISRFCSCPDNTTFDGYVCSGTENAGGVGTICGSNSDCKKTLTCIGGICDCLPTQNNIGSICTSGTPGTGGVGTICGSNSNCKKTVTCIGGICDCLPTQNNFGSICTSETPGTGWLIFKITLQRTNAML